MKALSSSSRWVLVSLGLLLAMGAPRVGAEPPEEIPIPLPEDRPARLGGEFQLVTSSPLSGGAFCPAGAACILGGGIALGAGVGRRWTSGLSLALAYELWLLDSGGVFEVFVVQSVSAALRFTALPSWRTHPFLEGRAGAAAMGDSFRVGALGALFESRVGVDLELTARAAVTGFIGLRWLLSTPFTTPNDGVRRGEFGGPATALTLGVGLLVVQVP